MEPIVGKKYWVHDISLDHAKLSKNERIFARVVDDELTNFENNSWTSTNIKEIDIDTNISVYI